MAILPIDFFNSPTAVLYADYHKRISIEVETGNSAVKGNVRKCKETVFDEVQVIRTIKWNSKIHHDFLAPLPSSLAGSSR